jgi:hypothetical protein
MTISREFAEKLFVKMQENSTAVLNADEIETLQKLLCNDIMLKAFGQAFGYCKQIQNEITQLDLSEPGASVQYTRGQGKIAGIAEAVTDLVNLIVEKEPEEDE